MENINEFAEFTTKKWYVSHDGAGEKDLAIMTLGLCGESGEVTEIIKKKLRDGVFDIDHFKSEMGDVIYYWSRLANAMGVLPSDILAGCVLKLETPRNKMSKLQLLDHVSNSIQNELIGSVLDSELADQNPFDEGSRSRMLAEELIQTVLNSGVKK